MKRMEENRCRAAEKPSEPERILHVVTTMDFGGVETLLMSIYRSIDRSRIQFDFLCHNRIEAKFTDEILRLGGRMYCLHGPRHGGIRNYLKEIKAFFAAHPEYSIVHAHMDRDSAFVLRGAKRAGVPTRIAHSHISGYQASFLYEIYQMIAKRICRMSLTDAFACSKEAGEELFGRRLPFHIVTNGIKVERFAFREETRERCRALLGIDEGTLLIGHVGRFDRQKNQEYLISVFEKIHAARQNTKLLLVGGGEKEALIRALAKKKRLDDAVLFAGQCQDVGAYYCAMDVFAFPSLFEGLGIVAVEAQTSGLPVAASEAVPKDAKITDRMVFLPLEGAQEQWAETILRLGEDVRGERETYAALVAQSPYNIENTVQFLQSFYLKRGRADEKHLSR